MTKRYKIDKKKLESMYKDEENFTVKEIADFFHCPINVIYTRIRKYKMPLRSPHISERNMRTYFQPKRWQDHLHDAGLIAEDIDRMHNVEGMNMSEIIRETEIPRYALNKIFEYNNIPFTSNQNFKHIIPERGDVDYDNLPLYAPSFKEACDYLVMNNMMKDLEDKQEEAWKKDQDEQFVLENSLPILIADKMYSSTQKEVIEYVNDIVNVAFPGADTPYKQFTAAQGLIMEAKKLIPIDDQYGGLTKEEFEIMKQDVTLQAFAGCTTEEDKQQRFKELMGKMGS